MRAHPFGMALVLVGSGLSVATVPTPPPETGVTAEVRGDSFDVLPESPVTLAFDVEISCTRPDVAERGGFVLTLEYRGVEGLADFWVTARRDGAADPAWEFLTDGEASTVELPVSLDDCVAAARCSSTIEMELVSDAPVRVVWDARAWTYWYDGDGNACLVFLYEA